MKQLNFRRNTLVLGVLCLLAASMNVPTVHAAATWFVATTGNNSNDCLAAATPCLTINGALAKGGFVAGDTVKVAVGTYTNTGEYVLLITQDVTLSGGWDATFTSQTGMSTIDGENTRRGVIVSESAVNMDHFIVQNAFHNFSGGGITNSGTLHLDYVVVTGNHANTGGAGIFNTGDMSINHSAISDNLLGSGGSGGEGAGIWHGQFKQLTMENSTISGNSINGGMRASALYAMGNVTIKNSTISNNLDAPEVLYFFDSSTGLLENVTLANNEGNGIFNYGGTVSLKNSILANQTQPDCFNSAGSPSVGTVNSLGYNLVEWNVGCALVVSDLLATDPKLSPLGDNGGPTQTMWLASSSPVLDYVPPANCALPTDQRGMTRPQNANCDSGAFEFVPGECATFTPPAPTLLTPGSSATVNALKVKFTWAGHACATHYIVQVRVKSATGKLLVDSAVDAAQLTSKKFDYGGKYVWRVTSCNQELCSESAWTKFTVANLKTGKWSGQTSQDGLPVEFYVTNKPTRWNRFKVIVKFPTCEVELTAPGPANIVKGKMNVGGAFGGGTLVFNGTFSDKTHFKGKFKATNVSIGCGILNQSGTWNAQWLSSAGTDTEIQTRAAVTTTSWNGSVTRK